VSSKDYNYEQYFTKNVFALIDEFNYSNYKRLLNDDYYYSILNQINRWRTGHLKRLNEQHIPQMKSTRDLISKELEK
jgi:hypothetical protein